MVICMALLTEGSFFRKSVPVLQIFIRFQAYIVQIEKHYHVTPVYSEGVHCEVPAVFKFAF